MFDQLEIPHKFFQNWIVLRIRDCVPLSLSVCETCTSLMFLLCHYGYDQVMHHCEYTSVTTFKYDEFKRSAWCQI